MRIILLLTLALLTSASLAQEGCDPQPLNILLTNDDGYNQPGITALHRSLVAAGHRVKRIAPARNFSGASASLTYVDLTATHEPSEEFSEIYPVNGSPATTVILGATAIFDKNDPPDLVVSGINNGFNIGPATALSGTVGAVVAGMNMVDPPLPGIAVSTGRWPDGTTAEENAAHVERAADFVASLVGNAQCGDRSFMTSGQSISINYPRVAATELRGVRVVPVGTTTTLSLAFVEGEGDNYDLDVERLGPASSSPDDEYLLVSKGYITIVPISGAYRAQPAFDADALLGGAL